MKKRYILHRMRPRRDGRWEYTVRGGGAVAECVSVDRDELTVPDRLGGLPVKTIGCYCFGGMDMYAVRLPDTLERIGAYAFSGCENLQAVVIPPGVRCMDETAFESSPEVCLYVAEGSYAHRWAVQLDMPFCIGEPDTSGLHEDRVLFGDFIGTLTEEGEVIIREYTGTARTLVIPGEVDGWPVVAIAPHAFACCGTLEEVVVPEGVEVLGRFAFHECGALRRVWLPDSLHIMGGSCFMYCGALESVRIPEQVRQVEFMCFAGCGALREVILPGMLRDIEPMAFCACRSLTELVLPASVQSIASSAFASCDRLRLPALPDGLDEESRSAFRGCIGWKEDTNV